MHILHTSDWHLGQHFMGKSREAEHQAFLDWLIQCVNEHQVDALIIAGDIFDIATPPSYARRLYNRFIVDLQNTCCQQLVVIGGNHDSVATLQESKELLACLNTFVVGGVAQTPQEQVQVLKNSAGQPGAVICAIPFIRPRDVLESRAGDSGEHKQQALQQAIADHYQSIYTVAEKVADGQLPIIATGHLTTVGGQLTESVREIYIGTLTAFPAAAFPPADYIALGHLHRPQRVSNHEHIRYSGSPIPLSFDEAGSDKEVTLVEFKDNRLHKINSLPVPSFRKLLSISATLDDIERQLEQVIAQTESFDLNPWVEIKITSDVYYNDLQNRVEKLVQDKPALNKCELFVKRVRKKSTASLALTKNDTLAELRVEDVFLKRLQQEQLGDEKNHQLTSAFQEILNSIHEQSPANQKGDAQ